MRIRFIIGIALLLMTMTAIAQDTDSLLNRLQGIRSNGQEFFNVDGVEISCIRLQGPFTPAGVSKTFKKLHVKAKELAETDAALGRANYYKPGEVERMPGVYGTLDYYFVQDKTDLVGFTFMSALKIEQSFERTFINMFLDGKVPEENYQPQNPSRINFAGRELNTWGGCRWMGPNNLQCPYNGQMNWSSFQTRERAQQDLNEHLKSILGNDRTKVLSNDQINVLFEGQDVTARKVVVGVTGLTGGVITASSGGGTLTAYLMIANVRGKFVTCVVSHWDNDHLNENDLPALAALVMTL